MQGADGTITTTRQVHGTVTAVSAESITVVAADGFSATFEVTADTRVRVGRPAVGRGPDGPVPGMHDGPDDPIDTISDVAVGDIARVDGTVSGSTATATDVHAMTAEEAAALGLRTS